MLDHILNTHLTGTHDIGSEHLQAGKPGWIVEPEAIGLNLNVKGRNYNALADQGLNVMVRLNAGYGNQDGSNEHGTIPFPHEYNLFAQTAAAFVARSSGCRIWIIGNEPNHKVERKGGVIITPEQYAECYTRCREAIKHVDPGAIVFTAGIAPYHADPMPWDEYLEAMLDRIAVLGGIDGFSIHAYARTDNAADISSTAKMRDYPLDHTYAGFLTYRDQLGCIPSGMNVPLAVITEFDQQNGWPSGNAGLYTAAVREINTWNAGGNPAVHGVVAYRWHYDKWAYKDNPGVQQDIRQAVDLGFRAPQLPTHLAPSGARPFPEENPFNVHLPSIHGGAQAQQPPAPTQPIDKYPVAWEPILNDRGVKIEKWVPASPDQKGFRIKAGEHWDPDEARGLHHIFLEVTDQAGNRLEGIEFRVRWPNDNGGKVITTRKNAGERYAADFPMSKSLNEFSVEPVNAPGDRVTGIGMGFNGNPAEHTSTWLQYEFSSLPIPVVNHVEPPPPSAGSAEIPRLVHPVRNPAYRTITQPYGRGVNAERYKRFRVDGVPLEGHNGVDYATPEGSEIQSVAAGTIVESAYDPGGFGEYIKIDHPWGQSLYAHLLRRADLLPGSIIQGGALIGLSGNTGNSEGPHLHFGIRVKPFNRQDGMGGFSDPLPLLSGKPAPPKFTGEDQLTGKGYVITAIQRAAAKYSFPWQLLAAQAWRESSFRPAITNTSTGAMGLFQIMPATWNEWAAKVGVNDPFNPLHSAEVGAAYLRWLWGQTGRDMRQALIAYGWGIGKWLEAQKTGQEPPEMWREYADTILYGKDCVEAVLKGLGVNQ